jgi:putative DNA-invertase from lambdoid prophage Rac
MKPAISGKTPNTQRRALGYARVSSILQATEGESLPAQVQKLQALCTLNGLALHDIFAEEGVSGAKPFRARPQGARLWAEARRGDVIVCLKLDRLSRNPADALALLQACRERGVGLVISDMGTGDLTQGAASAMLVGILSSVAGFERERNGERVAEVKAMQQKEGRYLGGPVPFAHVLVERDGEKFVDVNTVLRDRVLDLRKREFSIRQICVELSVRDEISVSQPAVAKFLRAHAA